MPSAAVHAVVGRRLRRRLRRHSGPAVHLRRRRRRRRPSTTYGDDAFVAVRHRWPACSRHRRRRRECCSASVDGPGDPAPGRGAAAPTTVDDLTIDRAATLIARPGLSMGVRGQRSSRSRWCAALPASAPASRRARPRTREPEKPVAGTSLLGVPGGQLLARRRRRLPVHPRSRQWLSHMSTDARPAPRLRAVVRRRARLRHPDHGGRRAATRRCGRVRLRRRERPGALPARHATPGSRAAAAPTATGTRSSSTRAPAGSTRPGSTRVSDGRWRAGSGAMWSLASNAAAPRRLDLRRRRRPADPARAAALERGRGRPRRPRDPVHHRRHQPPPPVAGPPRRRLAVEPRLPADGRPLPAEGVVLDRRASPRRPGAWSAR